MKKVEPSLVVQIRKANPCATLREIGEQVGVSYESVRQILVREGVPTASVRPPKPSCICGKWLDKHSKWGKCRACHKKEWTFAALPCAECGTIVNKKVSEITNSVRHGGQGRVFCNRLCKGRWLGEHFGFGPHPENQRQGLLTHAARRSIVIAAELCPPRKEARP